MRLWLILIILLTDKKVVMKFYIIAWALLFSHFIFANESRWQEEAVLRPLVADAIEEISGYEHICRSFLEKKLSCDNPTSNNNLQNLENSNETAFQKILEQDSQKLQVQWLRENLANKVNDTLNKQEEYKNLLSALSYGSENPNVKLHIEELKEQQALAFAIQCQRQNFAQTLSLRMGACASKYQAQHCKDFHLKEKDKLQTAITANDEALTQIFMQTPVLAIANDQKQHQELMKLCPQTEDYLASANGKVNANLKGPSEQQIKNALNEKLKAGIRFTDSRADYYYEALRLAHSKDTAAHEKLLSDPSLLNDLIPLNFESSYKNSADPAYMHALCQIRYRQNKFQAAETIANASKEAMTSIGLMFVPTYGPLKLLKALETVAPNLKAGHLAKAGIVTSSTLAANSYAISALMPEQLAELERECQSLQESALVNSDSAVNLPEELKSCQAKIRNIYISNAMNLSGSVFVNKQILNQMENVKFSTFIDEAKVTASKLHTDFRKWKDHREVVNHPNILKFIDDYKNKELVDASEKSEMIAKLNGETLQKAENAEANVIIETRMKAGNDKLVLDKDLMTALSSYSKEQLLVAARKYDPKIRSYEDFKSAITQGKINPNERQKIENEVYSAIEQKFAEPGFDQLAKLIESRGVGLEKDPRKLFNLGMADANKPVEYAMFDARFRRSYSIEESKNLGPKDLDNYLQNKVNQLENNFDRFEQMAKNPATAHLFKKISLDNKEVFIPNDEVILVLRQTKADNRLRSPGLKEESDNQYFRNLRDRINIQTQKETNLDDASIKSMLQFHHDLDFLTPNTLFDKKVSVIPSSTTGNVMSFDVRGAGVINETSIAESLAKAKLQNGKLDIEQTVNATRSGVKTADARMDQLRADVIEGVEKNLSPQAKQRMAEHNLKIGDILRISADDAALTGRADVGGEQVQILTDADFDLISKAFAKDEKLTKGFRTARGSDAGPARIFSKQSRSNIIQDRIANAESVDKRMREHLDTRMKHQKIYFEVQSLDRLGVTTYRLKFLKKPSPEEYKKIMDAYQLAVPRLRRNKPQFLDSSANFGFNIYDFEIQFLQKKMGSIGYPFLSMEEQTKATFYSLIHTPAVEPKFLA